MNLQEHFLLTAAAEENLTYFSFVVNHETGCGYIDGKNKGLVFPRSLYKHCLTLWATPIVDYYFKGILTPKRKWCLEYSDKGIIKNSNRGRNPKLKFSYDMEYYKELARSKFALCPTGDCPWSYRFFEAIMCGAIPVLGDDDIDKLSGGFKFYRHSDEKKYRIDWAEHNILLFEKRNLL